MFNAILGADNLISSVVTQEFKMNFRKLLKQVTDNFSKVVLVSIYLPYLGTGSSHAIYTPISKTVIEKWNKFVTGIAREFDIPILDLSRTINPGDRSHYSTIDDTRASDKSSKCIAETISYIFHNYNGSRIYYATDINSSKNNS